MIRASWHPKTASWGLYANGMQIAQMLLFSSWRSAGGFSGDSQNRHTCHYDVVVLKSAPVAVPRVAQLCTLSPTYHHRERGVSGGKEG